MTKQTIIRGVWSQEEHDKFLEGLQLYPQGPWKSVASHVGTRSVRQVQTHAQKYHEKVARRLRGLRKDRKKATRKEHRIDDEMVEICKELEQGRLTATTVPGQRVLSPTVSLQLKGSIGEANMLFMRTTSPSEASDSDSEHEETEMDTLSPQHQNATKTDLPPFSFCLDYLIDVFSNNCCNHNSSSSSKHDQYSGTGGFRGGDFQDGHLIVNI